MRLAAVQAAPPLRIFASSAPSTATSMSAPGSTMSGALPPSSIEALTTLSAQACSRSRPTSVEPVKESFRTSGLLIILATRGPVGTGVTRLTTPLRDADAPQHLDDVRRGQRGLAGRFEDGRAAGGQRGSELPGRHGGGEVPRRDQQGDADRLPVDDDALVAGR